jgi:predicted GNAT family N-acyltransferase
MGVHVVDVKNIRPLRNLVLRPNLPIETTFYDLDFHKETIHLGFIKNNQIVSIGTFYPQNDIELKSKNGFRLRGMATHPDFRRNSYASKLMLESFRLLQNKKCDIIWCNARLIAIDFYRLLGFTTIGNEFNIKDIGPHYKMFKKFN